MASNFTPNFGYHYGATFGLGGLSSGLTIAAWVLPDTVAGGSDVICSDWDNEPANSRHVIFRHTNGTLEGIFETGSGQVGGTFALTLTVSVWNHVVYHWDGTTLSGYLNGTVGGTTYAASGTTDADPTFQNFHIGNEARATTVGFDGSIAEFGFWNVPLSTGEITSLSRGVPPLKVRSGSLKHYMPFYNNIPVDLRGGLAATNNGAGSAATSNHAPVAPMFAVIDGWHGTFSLVVAPPDDPYLGIRSVIGAPMFGGAG